MKSWFSPTTVSQVLAKDHFSKWLEKRGYKYYYDFSKCLFKKDTYYSFNGDGLNNPKKIIRIRSENSMVITDNEDIDICKVSQSDFAAPADTFLTVKKKSTDTNGIETNEEYECALNEDTLSTVSLVLDIANFKPYFNKEKSSISFYVSRVSDNKILHCEIVAVNGIGPLLEVEAITPDSPEEHTTDGKCETVEEARELLKDFFLKVFGIMEFEKRTWPEIIKDFS